MFFCNLFARVHTMVFRASPRFFHQTT